MILVLGWLLALAGTFLQAQVVTTDPALPRPADAVVLTFDATEGNQGLLNYTGDVYAHTGVLTNQSTSGSDWRYVIADWNTNVPEAKMTRVATNTYTLDIGPDIRSFYGVPAGEEITHLAFVFRSADRTREGKDAGNADIFVEVFPDGLSIHLSQPGRYEILSPGASVSVQGDVSEAASLRLTLDGTEVAAATGTSLSHDLEFASPGDHWIKLTATAGEETVSDSSFIHVLDAESTAALPAGAEDGINYPATATQATLVLYAPGKEHAFVLGDFNDWLPLSAARMHHDGDRFWITLDGLLPGEEYAFQYLVDGDIQVADPYTRKVLDPWNDRFIPESTYPDLKAFPTGFATRQVSVLETGQATYEWQHPGFTAPPAENLVIYELLVRDFVAAHDYKTLTDTLDYLGRLGVNAIELMPVNEFEGNESWGYNPAFYFAPDKYYGRADDLKAFVDSCHGRGMAVIADMVLNHSYGSSPLLQLYYDAANDRPAADNPWYNAVSPNPVYFWGYDFNHESEDTRTFVDRVNRYWMEEFRMDGFRFDFTKGFTNTYGDGWAYDPYRIAILKRMADAIWSVNSDAYVILEHLSENTEETELAAHGMLLWGNMNYNYNEATMGYTANSDLSRISYLERGWSAPRLVGYMESHDEERLMYKNLAYGNSSGSYDITNESTALARLELAGAFFFPVPGPKMIWQFGEVGYDFSINYDCRVCNKPIHWDYYTEGLRRRVYQVWSALIRLKTSEPAFSTGDFTLDVDGAAKRIALNHADMDVRIVGNFDVAARDIRPTFSRSGWWYDFFGGDSLHVTATDTTFSLAAGEYKLFTTKFLGDAGVTASVRPPGTTPGHSLQVWPNPARDHLFLDPSPEASVLRIVTLSGVEVRRIDLPAMAGRADLSGLSGGLYLLERSREGRAPERTRILIE
ncbi:MAG: alpha-amylase family glycosyl hydrolase [Bacteroidales bacterium]